MSFLEEKEQLPVLESFREIFSEKTKAPPREIMIHGDLHPHNILVQKGRFYCIDWDLAKTGPLEIDILTLFTSPFLKISPPRRTHLVKDAGNYPFPLAEQKIKDFLNYKVKQLEFLPEGPFKGRLITAYKEVQRACDC